MFGLELKKDSDLENKFSSELENTISSEEERAKILAMTEERIATLKKFLMMGLDDHGFNQAKVLLEGYQSLKKLLSHRDKISS